MVLKFLIFLCFFAYHYCLIHQCQQQILSLVPLPTLFTSWSSSSIIPPVSVLESNVSIMASGLVAGLPPRILSSAAGYFHTPQVFSVCLFLSFTNWYSPRNFFNTALNFHHTLHPSLPLISCHKLPVVFTSLYLCYNGVFTSYFNQLMILSSIQANMVLKQRANIVFTVESTKSSA